MDDNRILWVKHVVYNSFNLKSNEIFRDFLTREDGKNRYYLEQFLNDTSELPQTSIQFTVKAVKETVFEEITIPSESKHYAYFDRLVTEDESGPTDLPNDSNLDVSDGCKSNLSDGQKSNSIQPEINQSISNVNISASKTVLLLFLFYLPKETHS